MPLVLPDGRAQIQITYTMAAITRTPPVSIRISARSKPGTIDAFDMGTSVQVIHCSTFDRPAHNVSGTAVSDRDPSSRAGWRSDVVFVAPGPAVDGGRISLALGPRCAARHSGGEAGGVAGGETTH
jgi:hypothetical protein